MGIAGLGTYSSTSFYYAMSNRSKNSNVGNEIAFGFLPETDGEQTNVATTSNKTGVASPNLTLHMSKEGDIEKSVGAWANPNAGRSITLYQTQDYDPTNPVYKMKVWDMDDNLLEERFIDVNSIDPNNADSYEMYALAVYGEKSGKCPDAVARFTMMHAKQEIEQTAQHGFYSLDTREDWIGILNDILKEQYDMGYMEGYMKNKAYLEYLSNR